ncbi:hypothetical protein [Lentibacillus sp.]|uniref:hypothetical protein n=1 Tax=Lentibacillus sp. TaxID=1925746 RepID=UPI002B4B172D|nr:hypothetical protein [Lentibacillus sp.]HLS08131.1 hypothetical protein [Lentibacillus sp.]
MSQVVQAYMEQEWNYYDMNLAKALEAVEQDDLEHASMYFQRISWALHSLAKYDKGNSNKSSISKV